MRFRQNFFFPTRRVVKKEEERLLVALRVRIFSDQKRLANRA